MPEPPRLDPRPARPLTTRELAKVIGATIGVVAPVLGAERTREMLRVTADDLRGEPIAGECNTEEVALWLIVFGQVRGLAGWCAPADVLTAIEWWLKPGALESLEANAGLLASVGGGERGLA